MPRTLDQVKEGEEVRIVHIGGRGAIRRRLLDMGVTRGTKVLLKRRAPLGDPLQIALKGYNLAIRKAEARYIEVQNGNEPGDHPGVDTDDRSGRKPAGKA